MNMLTVKVGVMPGKLVEVAVEKGISAREIFEIAQVAIGNHEIRLDGNKISLDTRIESGTLLVAMKMIKGNAPSIKVGQMPGRLTEVELFAGASAKNLFDMAGVEVSSNHEIRLDGNKIDINTIVANGSLLVAMKMIKGNVRAYVSELSSDEIAVLTDCVGLPTVIEEERVELLDTCVFVKEHWTVEKDIFLSIYTLSDVEEEINTCEVAPIEQVAHVCQCEKTNEKVEKLVKDAEFRLSDLQSIISYHSTELSKYTTEKTILNKVLETLK